MFKLGDIIPCEGPEGTEYYIVIEVGHRPLLAPLDDYIMRRRTVLYEGEHCTLKEIVEREKQRMISRRYINA